LEADHPFDLTIIIIAKSLTLLGFIAAGLAAFVISWATLVASFVA
jgi:hypothetical protein